MNAIDMKDPKILSVLTGEAWSDGRIKATIMSQYTEVNFDHEQVLYRVTGSRHFIDTSHVHGRLHVGMPINATAGVHQIGHQNSDYTVAMYFYGQIALVEGTLTVREDPEFLMIGSFQGMFVHEQYKCSVVGEEFKVKRYI